LKPRFNNKSHCIDVNSGDVWTTRWLTSSSRRAAEALASLRYEDFRIAGIFPNELDWSPAARVLYRGRSLRLRVDIFFRWTFIPAAVGVTAIVCVYIHTALFSA